VLISAAPAIDNSMPFCAEKTGKSRPVENFYMRSTNPLEGDAERKLRYIYIRRGIFRSPAFLTAAEGRVSAQLSIID
jgi:hypothetical protein